MPEDSLWRLDIRPAGEDSLDVILGGRWCLDAKLPTSGTLQEALGSGIHRARLPSCSTSNPMPFTAASTAKRCA